MKHLIIGTAGHIDHGKTTLIRALTGRETDRLEEEKKRGISIELGFTYFDLPSGVRAGIVDVPGHEKFIKNMLAGVAGMDIVILVVAADEGVMAQTREHLEILRFTGITEGIIALTKADLVDEEWLEMAKEDISDAVSGTFLEKAPIFPVSSLTGEGIPALVKALDEMATVLPDRSEDKLVRYGIDRVFTISGFGTVVTGTLVAGQIKTGQDVMIYPARKKAKVRNLQVHDQNVDTAHAGQRVAINLAGVTKEEMDRGDILSNVDALVNTPMLDIFFSTVELPFPLENRTRLRLYIGTTEVLCRLALLDRDEMHSFEEGFAQLRLEEEIAVQPGDHFVLRLYSPLVTVGGGEIVDTFPHKKKRVKAGEENRVERLYHASPEEALLLRLEEHDGEFLTLAELAAFFGEKIEQTAERIHAMKEQGMLYVFDTSDARTVLSKEKMDRLVADAKNQIRLFHLQYPLRPGIAKESLRSSLLSGARNKVGEKILQQILLEGSFNEEAGIVSMQDFCVELTAEQKSVYEKLLAEANASMLPLRTEDLGLSESSEAWLSELLQYMIRNQSLTRIEDDLLVSTERFNEAIETMKKILTKNGKITVAETRDTLNTNRKVALGLLSVMDQMKITKRVGDERVLA